MEAVYLWCFYLGITAAIVLVEICVYKIVSGIGEWFFDYKEGEE